MYLNELINRSLAESKLFTERQTQLLQHLGVFTYHDLLTYFPFRYDDRSTMESIRVGLLEKRPVTVKVRVIEHQSIFFNRRPHPKIVVQDEDTRASLVGFNRDYLRQALQIGKYYYLTAEFVYKFNEIQASSFDFEEYREGEKPTNFGSILPVYRVTEGLTIKELRKLIDKASKATLNRIDDELPQFLIGKRTLINKQDALKYIHFPESFEFLRLSKLRLAYEELFAIQLAVSMKRMNLESAKKLFGYPREELLGRFLQSLPYELTNAQRRVIKEVVADMRRGKPMHRLIQGDVGSGKTTAAMAALALAADNGLQSALMVPTETLAIQHYESLKKAFDGLGVRVALLTGSVTGAERSGTIGALASGEVAVAVGTHALFQDDVVYRALGCIVIDEQHKFGVEQRIALSKKGENPDILVMTATPIPRSLTLTIYGDLDVSIIDELPANRIPIKTHLVPPSDYPRMLGFIKKQLAAGQQAFFIYPLIEDSDKLEAKSAMQSFEKHKLEFDGFSLGLVHGRMKPAEKASVMKDFQEKKIDILVSTTVIEVGIDVPNATVMVIENGERFGLSQLHQLRGRVGRGTLASHCFIVVGKETLDDSKEKLDTKERMETMVKYSDGFKIAEEDLRQRGPGEILGARQSGLPELKIADFLADFELLDQARKDALEILGADPKLQSETNKGLAEGIVRYLPKDYLSSG